MHSPRLWTFFGKLDNVQRFPRGLLQFMDLQTVGEEASDRVAFKIESMGPAQPRRNDAYDSKVVLGIHFQRVS
jgi:hypothetical protein